MYKDKKSDVTGKGKRRITPLPSFDEINLMSKEQQDKIYKKIKARTEITISKTGKTVGTYIYETLLQTLFKKYAENWYVLLSANFIKTNLSPFSRNRWNCSRSCSAKFHTMNPTEYAGF